MATSTFRRSGEIRDRGNRIEQIDKPTRLRGASWIEPGGAAVLFDDFLGDTLASDLWLATETSAGGSTWAITAAAGDPVAGHGGWISATTDNIDASAHELAIGPDTNSASGFRADRAGNGMLVFETRVSKPTALTTVVVNAGLAVDATVGAALQMTLSTVTWTTTAVDAAMWGLYSIATDNTHWLGQTVDTNTDGTHIVGPTAAFDTAVRLRIELDSAGRAYFFADDAFSGVVDTGTSPDVILTPYLGVGGTTTTTTAMEADYVLVACAR